MSSYIKSFKNTVIGIPHIGEEKAGQVCSRLEPMVRLGVLKSDSGNIDNAARVSEL